MAGKTLYIGNQEMSDESRNRLYKFIKHSVGVNGGKVPVKKVLPYTLTLYSPSHLTSPPSSDPLLLSSSPGSSTLPSLPGTVILWPFRVPGVPLCKPP